MFNRSTSFPNPQAIMIAGHVCLDMTPRFPMHSQCSLAPGSLIRVEDLHRSVGGAVANTGLALHQLGVNTRLMGRMGDDQTGFEILRLLNKISSSLTQDMIQIPGESTSYSIVISPPNVDRLFLHNPGCNDQFSASDITFKTDHDTRILHFGYPPIMRTIYQNNGDELVNLFTQAHAIGMATSLDMCSVDAHSDAGKVDWKCWLKNVLEHVDFFVPSLDELLFMMGIPETSITINLLESVTDTLLDWGVRIVLLKLGDQGLYLRTTSNEQSLQQIGMGLLADTKCWQSRSIYAPCFEVEVVSTNGAGDYTIAGFLAGILANQNPLATLQSAIGSGASHVANPTQLPPWQTIQDKINLGWTHRQSALDLSQMQVISNGVMACSKDPFYQPI